MAVVNTKSPEITALDATPNTLGNAKQHCVVQSQGVAVVAADDDTSVYRVCRVRSSQRFYGMEYANTAITNGTSYDFGLYRTSQDGGAVVDANNIVAAATMASARLLLTAATVPDSTIIGKRYWEIAGATVDPCYDYDLCWTANTVGTVDGTINTQVLSSAV